MDTKGVSPMYKNKKGRMHKKMKYSILIEDIVVSSSRTTITDNPLTGQNTVNQTFDKAFSISVKIQ